MCWSDWLAHAPAEADDPFVGGAQGKDGPIGSPMFLEEQGEWAGVLAGDYGEDPDIGAVAELWVSDASAELAESPDAFGSVGAWLGGVGDDLQTAESNQAWTTSSGAARGACLAAGLYWDAKAGKCLDKAPGGGGAPAPPRPAAPPPAAPPTPGTVPPGVIPPSGGEGMGETAKTAGLALAGVGIALVLAKVLGL